MFYIVRLQKFFSEKLFRKIQAAIFFPNKKSALPYCLFEYVPKSLYFGPDASILLIYS